MIFDQLGLPKEKNADDWQDSSRLAGLMTLFDWPEKVDLLRYIIMENEQLKFVRHPVERKYDFSRDQYLCLIAGLSKTNSKWIIDSSFVDGKDILSPSNRGHVKRCKGHKASLFETLWLYLDIFYHAYLTPISEPNQLLAMMMVAGDKYLKTWTKHNKYWRESVSKYWGSGYGSWRGEDDFARHIIKVIESRIR